ncbi:MAG TPA: PP2C family serine/threonine-protein phosphatase [Pseudonocardiaceae bacterium]
MTLVLRYAARSDRGLVRSNNQDAVYAGPRLLALADGMGGHAAGEVASKVVIAALAPLDDDEPGEDLLGQLRDAVQSGNAAIAELVASDPDLDGMGTTLTAVLFAGSKIGLVHVGDSRAYLLRDGVLTQITHDDTFVQSLIDEGRITPEEAVNHPQRSLLLRALTGNEVEPSLTIREARAGDRYLLCSDGLSGVVSHETLAETLRIPDPQACADRLIELALRGGGPDNVTCIVADVVDVDFGENAPIVGGSAGDGSEDPPPPDSPASRAALAAPRPQQTRPEIPLPPPTSAQDKPPKKRRGLRMGLGLIGVLVLLGGGGFAGYTWMQQQYFVGVAEDGEVAIFRGLSSKILGIPMHQQVEDSCPPGSPPSCERITIDDLKPASRDTVRRGITSDDGVEGARKTIIRLRTEQLLPPCPQSTEPPADSPTTPPPTPETTTAAPPEGEGEGATPPEDGNTTAPAQPTDDPNQSAPPTTDETAPEDTPLPTMTLQPGVECRMVS